MAEPVCPECGGSGVVALPRPDRRAPRRYRPCACQARLKPGRLAAASGIPARFTACTFDTFRPGPGQRAAWEAARDTAANYPGHERGLLLYGGSGVGKTHLAAAAATALIARGLPVKFADYGRLLDALRGAYSGAASEGEVIEPFARAPVLILDDLGARRMTEWTHDVITRLIDYRYAHLPDGLLIVTTNRVPETAGTAPPAAAPEPVAAGGRDYLRAQLNAAAGAVPRAAPRPAAPPQPDALADLFDERLLSRLLALCRPVAVVGEDRRRS